MTFAITTELPGSAYFCGALRLRLQAALGRGMVPLTYPVGAFLLGPCAGTNMGGARYLVGPLPGLLTWRLGGLGAMG